MPTTTKAKNPSAERPNEAASKGKGAKTEFTKENYLFWYESMQLMRKFEERAGQLYGMQKIKGFLSLIYRSGGLRRRRDNRVDER